MDTRPLLPLLVLALLGVLTAGAVVWGLELAPATANLLVHNAGGELVTAPSFTANYKVGGAPYHVKFDYTAPDHGTEYLVGTNGKVEKSQPLNTLEVKAALADFGLGKETFVAKGAAFVATRPAVDIYPVLERHLIKSGSATWVVTVRTGVIATEHESIHVVTSSGAHSSTADLKITSVGGVPVGG